MRNRRSYSFRSSDFRGDGERRQEPAGDAPEGDRACSRAEWCASAKRERQDDGTVLRTPAKTYQAFCHADRGIIGACIAGLPATYGRLGRAIGDHVTAEALVRVPFGPSVPLRTDVDELMRLIIDAAMSWHERVAAVARLSLPDTQAWHRKALGPFAAGLLLASVPVLAAHLDALLALGAEPMVRPASSPVTRSGTVIGKTGDTALVECGGADAGLEILRLDFLARSALLETRPAPVRLIGVPCRSCQKNALQLAPPPQHDGDPVWHSVCVICRDAMDEPTFRAWTKAWANYYSGRVTPAMAAMAATG